MRYLLHAAVLASAVLIVTTTAALAGGMTDEDIIKSAETAAPAAVAKDATIVAMDAQMKLRTVREGKNGFTCFADNPDSPGPDPMCVDKGGMAWMKAWIDHQDPPKGVIGFGYMLGGGSDPSNTDPYATKPAEGADWITTPPHVMIFNVGAAEKDYPTGENPPTNTPWIMYPNTPYAHIMIPVQ